MTNGSDVNSRSYWDDRFQTDWDQNQGRAQSRFFGRVALDMLPEWFRCAARSQQWGIVDWGCAEGDGTQVLAETLACPVVGVDFSEEAIARARAAYPDIPFQAEDWLSNEASHEPSHDVVFSSNTLEHFHSPWAVFKVLAAHARHSIMLLLPFREFERHFEHFATFDFNNIHVEGEGFVLCHFSVLDTTHMPGSQWPGEQVLLIYMRPATLSGLRLAYSDLTLDTARTVGRHTQALAEAEGAIKQLGQRLDAMQAELLHTHVDRTAWTNKAMEAAEQRDVLTTRLSELASSLQVAELRAEEQAKELSQTNLQREEAVAQLSQANLKVEELSLQLLQANTRLDELHTLIEEHAGHAASLRDENLQLSQSSAGECGRLAETIAVLEQQLARRDRGPAGMVWRLQSRVLSTRIGRGLAHMRREGLLSTLALVGSRIYRRWAMTWYALQFDTFLRARNASYPVSWSKVRVAAEPDMVSVVLPCFNGDDMVAESIDSVLSQSYRNFELILLNDGSTDGTAEIFDHYAKIDSRIRVVHQQNMRLPRTLSRGFRMARGEFLTWTSADNRMKPDCLERLVESLRRDDDVDMVYGNMDIIGPDGSALKGSGWYASYQSPAGSEHIHLPRDTAELNTWANNYIGACFMYRARVAHLIRDYSAERFCTEDYDYWMRINAMFRLRHVGIDQPLYEYRFHPNSLTSKDKELRITENRTRLMVFEDFRRSFLLSTGVWVLEPAADTAAERAFADTLAARLTARGHKVYTPQAFGELEIAPRWTPTTWMRIAQDAGDAGRSAPDLEGVSAVLVAVDSSPLPEQVSEGWTWCVCTESGASPLRLAEPYQGWACVEGVDALIAAADVLAKEQQLAAIEADAEAEHAGKRPPELEATIVICTYRRSASLPAALRSAARQDLGHARYEIVVVNNDPAESHPRVIADEIRREEMSELPGHLRVIDCPIPGLSHARNSGLAASRGAIVLFLDDDAVAEPDCLSKLIEAYRSKPQMGVVGGHIVLTPPVPTPDVVKPGREGLWSHLVTPYKELTQVDHFWEFPWGANWSARREVLYAMGGFRANFGRNGGDYGGGEEIVAAALARQLGMQVGIEPRSSVQHQVEAKRFTSEHVAKTVMAGVMVNYQMQKSMYLPFEASLVRNTGALVRDWMVVTKQALRSALGRPPVHDALLGAAQRAARRRLWRQQWSDRMDRLKRPVVRT